MSKTKTPPANIKTSAVPLVIQALLEKPALMEGELRSAYYDLFARLVAEIRPTDLVEWLGVLQFTDSAWYAQRMRGLRVDYLDEWHTNATEAMTSKSDYSIKNLAQTTNIACSIDRMIERAERACDQIVQQLELRRSVFGARVRAAAGHVLNPPSDESKSTSVVPDPSGEPAEAP